METFHDNVSILEPRRKLIHLEKSTESKYTLANRQQNCLGVILYYAFRGVRNTFSATNIGKKVSFQDKSHAM